MTALIYVITDAQVCIAADTLMHEDHAPRSYVTKILTLPHLRGAIAGTGSFEALPQPVESSEARPGRSWPVGVGVQARVEAFAAVPQRCAPIRIHVTRLSDAPTRPAIGVRTWRCRLSSCLRSTADVREGYAQSSQARSSNLGAAGALS